MQHNDLAQPSAVISHGMNFKGEHISDAASLSSTDLDCKAQGFGG